MNQAVDKQGCFSGARSGDDHHVAIKGRFRRSTSLVIGHRRLAGH
jgi:hypothetical protein